MIISHEILSKDRPGPLHNAVELQCFMQVYSIWQRHGNSIQYCILPLGNQELGSHLAHGSLFWELTFFYAGAIFFDVDQRVNRT